MKDNKKNSLGGSPSHFPPHPWRTVMNRSVLRLLASAVILWAVSCPGADKSEDEGKSEVDLDALQKRTHTSSTIMIITIEHEKAGIGAEQGEVLFRAQRFLQKQEFAKSEKLVDRILAAFRKKFTDKKAVYICVPTKKELERYRKILAKSGKKTQKVIRVHWSYREALQMKAFLAAGRKQWDKALDLLAKQQEVAPYNPSLYVERGYVLNNLGRFKEALTSYRIAIKMCELDKGFESNKPLALRGIGFALIELGKLDEAKKTFEESLKIDPGNKLALNELGYIRQLQEKQKKAKANP